MISIGVLRNRDHIDVGVKSNWRSFEGAGEGSNDIGILPTFLWRGSDISEGTTLRIQVCWSEGNDSDGSELAMPRLEYL